MPISILSTRSKLFISNLPASHRSPKYPAGHVHLTKPAISVHVPLFSHVCAEHFDWPAEENKSTLFALGKA